MDSIMKRLPPCFVYLFSFIFYLGFRVYTPFLQISTFMCDLYVCEFLGVAVYSMVCVQCAHDCCDCSVIF